MKCEAFLSFFFFLFLYTVSLHGTPTGEIKLMELSESEQLTNFAILTFQPRSAFTFFQLYKWYQIAQRITVFHNTLYINL